MKKCIYPQNVLVIGNDGLTTSCPLEFNNTKLESISLFKKRLIEHITLDNFLTYHNGNLVDIFFNISIIFRPISGNPSFLTNGQTTAVIGAILG